MDFDSPEDAEKDFPGLYASEGADGKSKKSKEDSDYSDGGEHDKVSKKELLIGRRKDKKDKGKDRGYAALEGESSPEEELDAKSPSKSKKSKAFKFSSSKSKEKREKSRDKEKSIISVGGACDTREEEPTTTKLKEKEKPDKDQKEHKKKDKERKEKDKKDKSKDKDKDKKDKKLRLQTSGGSGSVGGVGVVGAASEEVLELGDVQPVFGVSISLATERSRCHDGIDLPLVVRDCIDYLQEHALKSDHIYKVEPVRTRLQQYKRLYNNRERQPDTDELDTPTACGLLKLFLRELPEPVLTTDLIARFEDVAAQTVDNKQQQQKELQELLELLPSCNRELLAWILLHFDAVLQNESSNKISSQSLAMLLSPSLQMSHRLLLLLCQHCSSLFNADLRLIKYVPPLTSSSPKLPDTPDDIQIELRKQESLLAQIHSEMNAGFVSKKREEQLWEVQRIITQLKRKLRSCEKRLDKSMDETSLTAPQAANSGNGGGDTIDATTRTNAGKQSKLSCSDDESIKTSAATRTIPTATITAPESATENAQTDSKSALQEETTMMVAAAAETEDTHTIVSAANEETTEKDKRETIVEHEGDALYFDEEFNMLMVPKKSQYYAQLLRLQLENRELAAWKTQLQTRISAERAEILRIKQLQQQMANAAKSSNVANDAPAAASVPGAAEDSNVADGDYDKIMNHFIRENTLLEHKKQILAKEIFDEQRECIALQVELSMQKF